MTPDHSPAPAALRAGIPQAKIDQLAGCAAAREFSAARTRGQRAKPRASVAGLSSSSATAGDLLGFVEAPDVNAAEAAAVKAFDLNEHQRSRLLLRERL
jgi:hypothetical protein